MFSISSNSNKKTSLIFWTGYTLYEGLFMGSHLSDFERSFFTILIHLPLIILASFYYLNFTIKSLYLKDKIIQTAISIVIGILLFGVLRRIITYTFIYPVYFPDALNTPLIYWPKIFYEATQIHMVVSLFIVTILVKESLQQQKLTNAYKQQKTEAEFNLLQSQVSPHFIFNTLNNLISVSIQKPSQMPLLLSQLGGLLHYQLEDSTKKQVSLKDELRYLDNYIALEKIRYGERLDIKTNFEESIADISIPPLLLLPFVENAFKHGASQIETLAWIQIRITISEGCLNFRVENSIPEIESTKPTTGLGLENLKKRLEILFPKGYELSTLREEGQFLAILKFKI